MTAIAGAWRLRGGASFREDCAHMLAAQSRYGPHGEALWEDEEMAMGRRLYRTLPEDRFDQGPLTRPQGIAMVADVRLDNRQALEASLGLSNQRLCDAAVLFAAWTRWEEACFDHLVGDYAFALWQPEFRRVVLARDPMGRRPLFFSRNPDRFAFASMPAGLLALPDMPKRPDARHLAKFLSLGPETGCESFFEGISRVEPGGLVMVTPDGETARCHYRCIRRPVTLASDEAYVVALRAQLDQAVGARLRRESGGLGAHLSAGLDSAAVAATAARLLKSGGASVLAFTAAPRPGYRGQPPVGRLADEGPLAAQTAALHDNLDLVLAPSSARSPLDDIDRDMEMNARPMLNLCNQVWLNDIHRVAKGRGVQVLLTGDIGNLAFSEAGLDRLVKRAHDAEWRQWWNEVRALTRNRAISWRGVLAATFADRLPKWLWHLRDWLRGTYLTRPGTYSALKPQHWVEPAWPRSGDIIDDRVFALTAFDAGPYLKGVLASYGLDLRDPLTDRRLVEFCLNVPTRQVLLGGQFRSLARRALADRVPAAVLAEPLRGYQGIDWHEGLIAGRAELTLELERLAACEPVANLLDIPGLQRLVQSWPVTGWHKDKVMVAYRLKLLRAVSAGRFMRRTLGANG